MDCPSCRSKSLNRSILTYSITLLLLFVLTGNFGTARADELKGKDAETTKPDPTEAMAARIRKSVVIVRASGRDGRSDGHGTGFVISKDGLIATARHVIGDRRSVRVELPSGETANATHVHAVTESVDIAVLRVDADNLTPLELGEAAKIRDGQSVMTVGYPRTTQYSFYRGLVSGRHEIDGLQMLKLSMTVEPGSSGEPVVDEHGRVLGIVTLKSTITANEGYAVPVNHLKALLKDPTEMPMSRWMTIGALDAGRWDIVFGANWRQRASRVLVDGYGDSFGGRSLCLQNLANTQPPYDLEVDIKLNDEAGAAGLCFHADGKNRHYGFYPSAGNIRLTRFNGPELQSWTILHNEPHPAWHAGEWNTIRVHVDEDFFECYVNGERAVRSRDDALTSGKAGLAVFRGTGAMFRRFRVGRDLPSGFPDDGQIAQMTQIVNDVSAVRPASQEVVSRMKPHARFAARFLEQQAEQLELKARRMRQLAADVHAEQIRTQLLAELRGDDEPDLLMAALLVAVLDNPEIEPATYVRRVEQLAKEAASDLSDDATEQQRLDALNRMFFKEYGFRGSRYEYYTRSNSYLNEVVDDREGLPIALSVLYMELGRRLDLNISGMGLPGHYVVQHHPQKGDPQIIDVFERGALMSRRKAEQIVRERGFPLLPQFFEPQTPVQIIRRMLVNLLGLAERDREDDRVLRYLEILVALDEEDPEMRAKRLEIRARSGRLEESLTDADWFIDNLPEGTNTDRLYELRAALERQLETQQQK